MSFFVNILALGVPIFTLQVYDRVVQHAAISTLWGLGIGLLIVLVFDYILRQARSRIMQTIALRVDVEVGRAVFDKFTSLPLNVLESRGGNYWQSLFRDVDTVRNTLSGAPAILICDLPFAIMFFVVIFIVAQPIVWVLMIIMVLLLFVTWRAGAATGKASSTERDSSQDRDSLIAEMIQGRATIKALALEGAMRPMWEERHAANIKNAITRGGRTDAYTNLGQTLTQSTSLMMTSFGALAIIGQELTMGSLIATNMLSGRLLGPLNQLVSQWRTYSGYRQAVERLGEVFDIVSERTESEVQLDKPKGNIECLGLTFAYAEGLPPVCDNVTVSFAAGGIHALVGRNGSGKTTLLKMMQGLYRPSNGRVLLDGADISQFSRAELAKWMGYVPQESTLFAGTVRDNITNRYPNATDEEIIKASKAAGVHEFIIDLPDGYGSDIGEAGQRLSGGQRQRIAIARALIGDPSVLMLDEPSSSLDRHAEQELRGTLKALSERHTVVIVTHSPILLAACDNLVALDKGKIALAGPAKDILPRLFGGAPSPPPTSPPAPSGPSGGPPSSPPPQPVQPPSGEAATVALKPTESTPTATSVATAKAPLPRPATLGAPAPAKNTAPPAKAAPSPLPTKSAPAKADSVKPVAKATATKSTLKPATKPMVRPVGKKAVKPGVKPAPKPASKPAPAVTPAPKEEPKAVEAKRPKFEPESGKQAFAKIEPVKIAVPRAEVETQKEPSPPALVPTVKSDDPRDDDQQVKPPVTPASSPLPPGALNEDEGDPYADALQSLSTDREDPSQPK